jgi:hypothetical protein
MLAQCLVIVSELCGDANGKPARKESRTQDAVCKHAACDLPLCVERCKWQEGQQKGQRLRRLARRTLAITRSSLATPNGPAHMRLVPW